MAENNGSLEQWERLQKKIGQYVELLRQKERLEKDPELAPFFASRQLERQGAPELPDKIAEKIEDRDELGLIGESKEETVRNLTHQFDEDSLFDRENVHEKAKRLIPQWAKENDERGIGHLLSRLARRGELEVHEEAKPGPGGRPTVFRLPKPKVDQEPDQQQKKEESDGEKGSEDADSMTF